MWRQSKVDIVHLSTVDKVTWLEALNKSIGGMAKVIGVNLANKTTYLTNTNCAPENNDQELVLAKDKSIENRFLKLDG